MSPSENASSAPRPSPDSPAPPSDGERAPKPAWLRALPLVALVVVALVLFFVLDLGKWLSFAALAEHHEALRGYASHPLAPLAFVAVYAGAVALSIPGATILTLTGGLLFGLVLGTLLVVGGATLGAAIVFLIARTAVGDAVRKRAGPKLAELQVGFDKNAFSYLLFLRLVPLFPFWLVNIVPAVLGMKLAPFALATFLGIIPGSAVYVSVGNGLSAILAKGETPDLGIIFEPAVIGPILALAALALVPIFVQRIRAKRSA